MNNELQTRKNIRLKEYDYSSAGYYFVTVCVKDRKKMLGKIVGAERGLMPSKRLCCDPACLASCRPSNQPCIELSKYGEIVQSWISGISEKYTHVKIDCYVVMPNHLHMILVIHDDCMQHDAAPTVNDFMRHDAAPTAAAANYSAGRFCKSKKEAMLMHSKNEINCFAINGLENKFFDNVTKSKAHHTYGYFRLL